MNKFPRLLSKMSAAFFMSLFLMPSVGFAVDRVTIGKYHCEEVNKNTDTPLTESDLFISNTSDKYNYKFVWYYADGTIYEGLNIPPPKSSSSSQALWVKYLDLNHMDINARESGVESFEIDDKKKLIGKFSSADGSESGTEECSLVYNYTS